MPEVRHEKSRDGDVHVSGHGFVIACDGPYIHVNIFLPFRFMLSHG